jgi:hypothetical protein
MSTARTPSSKPSKPSKPLGPLTKARRTAMIAEQEQSAVALADDLRAGLVADVSQILEAKTVLFSQERRALDACDVALNAIDASASATDQLAKAQRKLEAATKNLAKTSAEGTKRFEPWTYLTAHPEYISPLQFMLRTMNDTGKLFEDRMEAAKSAAPYMHQKLASVEVTTATDAVDSEIKALFLEGLRGLKDSGPPPPTTIDV